MCFKSSAYASSTLSAVRRRLAQGDTVAARNLLSSLQMESSMQNIVIDGKAVSQHIRELSNDLSHQEGSSAAFKRQL